MKYLCFCLAVFLHGCSSLTENRVLNSVIVLDDSFADGKALGAPLKLKRTSWYKGAILHYDIIYSEVDHTNPYYQWLLKDFPDMRQRCKKFVVSMSHSDFNNRASRGVARDIFNKSGAIEFVVPEFSYQWKTHPETKRWSVKKHRVLGHCYKETYPSEIPIALPGFALTNLQI